MPKIATEYKRELSALLAKGHAKFGKVAPRRDYCEDEDDEGGGGAELLFETHPLLANQPEGAASDLTFVVTQNSESVDEGVKRQAEANPELGNKLANVNANRKSHMATPKPL
ncbi:MAG: hypothetical protein KAS93_03055 [Gammaproteobacteria bacterium]|nr:hypothetical protein [Gammaproteobacteria bacterium]